MKRVGSIDSIGLDLDQPVERPNGRVNAPYFSSRDLVTPSITFEASQSPPLSPCRHRYHLDLVPARLINRFIHRHW